MDQRFASRAGPGHSYGTRKSLVEKNRSMEQQKQKNHRQTSEFEIKVLKIKF
jgi:hypothetical protein